MLSFVFLGFVIGYFIGRWDWKKIADEACETAGHAIMLAERYKEELEHSHD